MKRINQSMMLGVLLAAIFGMVTLTHCDGDGGGDDGDTSGDNGQNGNNEAETKCQLVCDKSDECGGAPADCMQQCLSNPPSDACAKCYEEESCADVGACYNAMCNEDDSEETGNVTKTDCIAICEKRTDTCDDGSGMTMEECEAECLTKTMVDDCLTCPEIEDCLDFWQCMWDYDCWGM